MFSSRLMRVLMAVLFMTDTPLRVRSCDRPVDVDPIACCSPFAVGRVVDPIARVWRLRSFSWGSWRAISSSTWAILWMTRLLVGLGLEGLRLSALVQAGDQAGIERVGHEAALVREAVGLGALEAAGLRLQGVEDDVGQVDGHLHVRLVAEVVDVRPAGPGPGVGEGGDGREDVGPAGDRPAPEVDLGLDAGLVVDLGVFEREVVDLERARRPCSWRRALPPRCSRWLSSSPRGRGCLALILSSSMVIAFPVR